MMDLHPGLMIWTVITFLLFLAVLAKFAWNPILKALDAREKGIKDDIAAAKAAREQAEQMILDYQQKLKDAHAETMNLIATARRDAERVREQELERTKAEASAMLEKARKQIELDSQTAIVKIRQEIATLAISSAEKLIRRSLTGEDQIRLINDSLESPN